MKIKDIAARYEWSEWELEEFVRSETTIPTGGFLDTTVNDRDVDEIVKLFSARKAQEAELAEEQLRKELERQRIEQEKQQTIAGMLVTSGFNFDGYTITRYSGYISGDDAVQIPRTGGFFETDRTAQQLTDALVKIRIQAIKELKEAAYDLGCNAIIGVDFDYITIEPEKAGLNGGTVYLPYVICVTANGNAVVIEKN